MLQFLEINKWKEIAFNDIKAAQMKSIGQKFEIWIWRIVFKYIFYPYSSLLKFVRPVFWQYKLLNTRAANIYGKYMTIRGVDSFLNLRGLAVVCLASSAPWFE